jgi:DNA modification methylase
MLNQVHFGDCRASLRAMAAAGVKVQMCVTSPPYFGLRDYGHEGQIGLEETPEEFIRKLVEVFRCVRDVLADDGTLWVNIGDSYATGTKAERQHGSRGLGAATQKAQDSVARIGTPEGCKTKDLIGIPWLLAFALRADGWYLRQDIIWHKPNPMPESVTDRCTKAHEYVFLLSKSPRYFYDAEAVKEPLAEASIKRGAVKIGGTKGDNYEPQPGDPNFRNGAHQWGRELDFSAGGKRNKRTIWTVPTKGYKGAHFAVFPPALIEPCILAGSRAGDIVLDPFMGSGTTAEVAILHDRRWIGCELNPEYKPLQDHRIAEAMRGTAQVDMFSEVANAAA